eukprot:7484748-Heterocapsa_arctica.AAC.1
MIYDQSLCNIGTVAYRDQRYQGAKGAKHPDMVKCSHALSLIIRHNPGRKITPLDNGGLVQADGLAFTL